MKTKANGRIYAQARGYGFDPVALTVTAGNPKRLELAAPDTATTGSYYWFKKENTPLGASEIGKVGIFFGGGAALALLGDTPTNLNYGNLDGAEYGRQFALQLDVTSPNNLQCLWYRKENAGAWQLKKTLQVPITDGSGSVTFYRFVALQSGESAKF